MEFIAKCQTAQYGDSLFHRLDPRVKIALALLFSLVGPLMKSPVSLAGLTLLALGYMLIAGLGRVLLAVTVFFLLSMVLYLFLEALIFQHEPKYMEYLRLTLTMLPIMCGGLLLGMTTPIERLTAALARLGMPAGMRYAIMVAMRYASMLGQEAGHALLAMRVRGVMPGMKDIFRNPLSTLYRLFVPILIRAFRVADRMAAAAEMRGLSGPGNNLILGELHMMGRDWGFLSLNLALIAVLWGISAWKM